MEYIAFDSHKRYTFASVEEHTGNILRDARIDHHRGAITEFLSAWKTGTEVAVETTGNWYWIVDEIEAAGMVPRLVHAHAESEDDAGLGEQDRQARCSRVEPSPAYRDASDGLDPAGADSGPAGSAPYANGAQPGAHADEEPHPRDAGQIRAEHRGGERCVRKAWTGRDWKAPWPASAP